MEKGTYTVQMLTASKGMVITNKEKSFFSTVVYLAVNDSPDNYQEITQEEAERIIAEREKENKMKKEITE